MNWLRMGAMVLAGALVVGVSSAPAAAGVPTDQLKGAVERVLKTLDDPTLKGEARLGERRVAVRKIANEIFDFSEIAKRSMARHWQPLSEAQKNEFVGLFADLLERSYISKIETYGGEKIQYTAERADGEFATVSTRIITKNGTEVPVDYRMIKRADRWLVYDVSIEGVSLVSNYRTQFNKIIQTTSYNELISKLRNKQDELLAEDKKKKP
ncbi:MAG TPA: ABC transporter substrate-binding protein [Candidatus Dormibacteraeota bacterium]|jgi:phospholipid transport system substrate-binding protein|nr:ABC transporter substrate-binding protein [Candidatus Dormibacteraeota bacterium]HYR70062.1 ABC transporter substrate-binding protein [Candidatus Acidoferrum sp.]